MLNRDKTKKSNLIDENRVILENKIAHDEEARFYDRQQYYVNLSIHNYYVDKELDIITNDLKKLNKDVYSVLDLGAGTGWIVSKIYKYNNFHIDAVDISEKMLELMRDKIGSPANVKVFQMEAFQFLEFATFNKKKYDLIIYSTVLHHLYDYMKVLRMSLPLINNGGYVYILNEPFKKPSALEIMDTLLHRLFRSRHGLQYSVLNVLFRNYNFKFSKYNKTIAEYHYYRGGIDVAKVFDLLKQNDFRIIKERRYVLSNFKFTYNLCQWLKLFNNHIALIGIKNQSAGRR